MFNYVLDVIKKVTFAIVFDIVNSNYRAED